MSGWTSSDINAAGLLCIVNGNAATSGGPGPFYGASSTNSFSGDTVDVTLWSNTPTTATALTDTLAHNTYNGTGGQWLTSSELATSGGYTQGGAALTTKTETLSSATATFTGANISWTSATFTAYGAMLYDNTITA